MSHEANPISKQFWRYVIPSVLSLSLTGIYCFVDAYFVGNNIGDAGLAAINISFAFISVVFAFGVGIGAGCSVKYSVFKAQNQINTAKGYIGTAMVLCFICSIALTIPMILFPEQILIALGATEKVSIIGKPYLVINGAGTIFQLFANASLAITRNCGGAIAGMISVVSGCVLNIVLDWLFVEILDLGIEGAAYATVLGQILSLVICLVFLIRTRNFKISFKKFLINSKDIMQIGISPFGLCLIPNISVVVLNKASLYFGGDTAIAAYGCMAYLVWVVYLILQGVGDGAQPLISYYHGEGNLEKIKKVKKMVFELTLLLSFFFFVFEFFFSKELAAFMGSTGKSAEIVTRGLPILAIGFFFVGQSRNIAACLYAEEHNIRSYIISYAEPIVILLLILLLPESLGLDCVWLSNTIAQLLVMILALILL